MVYLLDRCGKGSGLISRQSAFLMLSKEKLALTLEQYESQALKVNLVTIIASDFHLHIISGIPKTANEPDMGR